MQVWPLRSDGCLGFVLVARGEAAVIDPTRDTARVRRLLAEQGATPRFVIDTHTHADHLSGGRKLADEVGARLVMSAHHAEQWRAAAGQADALGIGDVLRANAGVTVDLPVKDGDSLELGDEGLRFLEAPGHTVDSLVVVTGDRAFTGDALLIGQTGRCDLPGGDPGRLHDTLFTRLAGLPDETFIYPGHDYQGQTLSALGFERVNNRFLKTRERAAFLELMRTAFPTLTGAGMQCGASAAAAPGASCASGVPADPLRDEVGGFMAGYFFHGGRPEDEVTPAGLRAELGAGKPIVLLDVREPSEFEGGHIEGATNLSVHQIDRRLGEVEAAKGAAVVTICRSGKRSGWAAMFLRVAGFTDVRSLQGGMLAWEAAKRDERS